MGIIAVILGATAFCYSTLAGWTGVVYLVQLLLACGLAVTAGILGSKWWFIPAGAAAVMIALVVAAVSV